MVRSSKGFRAGTRKKMKRGLRQKFKSNQFLQEFKAGDKVIIKTEPSSQDSIPHSRLKGKIGEVIGKRGRAYVVKVGVKKGARATKQVITRPEHLRIHG